MYSDDATLAPSDYAKGDCQFLTQGHTCGSECKAPTGDATCPAGYWCSGQDEMTAAISKYPCPPGFKSSALTGAARTTFANSCEECVSGNYCDGADHAQTTCPAGYFCPAGTKFATQFPCPAATSSTTGQTSVAGCTACTSGTFCPPGTGTPRPCPPGAACNGLMLDRYSDLCPAGTYFQTSSCVICPADHYCPPGVHYPLKCPAGTKGANVAA